MRLKHEYPADTVEQQIYDILVACGYNEESIQFRDTDRYLRVGYWGQLSDSAKAKLGNLVSEMDMYDDDCGDLYFYNINR
jgi:hypothetical protein